MTIKAQNSALTKRGNIFAWFGPLCLLIGLIVITAIVSFYEFPFSSMMWSEIQNVGHIFVFGLLSIIILKLLNSILDLNKTVPPYNYLYSLILALLLGIITEVLQIPGPRDADPMDVLRDLIGIVVFLAIFMAADKRLIKKAAWFNNKRRQLLVIGAAVILAVSLAPAAIKGYAIMYKIREFPTLCDFDSRWDELFIQTHKLNFKRVRLPSEMHSYTESYVGFISPKPSKYSSLELVDAKRNWTGFDTVSFVIYSDMGKDIPLNLRINDEAHNNMYNDRFNQQLIIKKGINKFNISTDAIENAPRSRLMNMKQIESIIIFFYDYKDSCALYVDDIKLH